MAVWMGPRNLSCSVRERTTTTNKDNFNGTYETTAWLPVFHFRTSF